MPLTVIPAGLLITAICSSSKTTSKLNSYILGSIEVFSTSFKTCPNLIQVPVWAIFPSAKNSPRLMAFFIPLFEGIKFSKTDGAYSCNRIFSIPFGTIWECKVLIIIFFG